MQLHKTRGIVLRTVKYGETSVVVSLYTELFGLQTYLVGGVRTSSRKGSGKANLFQPGAILDMVVYHNDLKNLQRMKEFKWGFLYEHIFFDVVKNAVALFMVELLQKCVKQPEPNADLFYFMEDALMRLDTSQSTELANYPLFFTLHLAGFFGFRIQDTYSSRNRVLDLYEGVFTPEHPSHQNVLEEPYSQITSQILRARQPHELGDLPLNQEVRRTLLQAYQVFYTYHVPGFGALKTLPVLQTLLG